MTYTKNKGADVKNIAERIAELLLSKTGWKIHVDRLADLVDDASTDQADRIACEVCAAICAEEQIVVSQVELAKIARSMLNEANRKKMRKLDRLAELNVAMEGPKATYTAGSNVMTKLSERLFAPFGDVATMSVKPLMAPDVCSCGVTNPDNITFGNQPLERPPESLSRQAWKARHVVYERLKGMGLEGGITARVMRHRGSCRVHGASSRRQGDGVAELLGVLVEVDLGEGVLLKGEFEVDDSDYVRGEEQ